MRRLSILLAFAGAVTISGSGARAAVIVVANRGSAAIECRLASKGAGAESARKFAIPPGDTVPMPLGGTGRLSFDAGGHRKAYDVTPHGIYYFGPNAQGEIDLGQIGSITAGDDPQSPLPTESPLQVQGIAAAPPTLVIPVKILFDQDEISSRAAWEKRMRARFEQVSRIFKQHCFVEFKIVAIDGWQADQKLVSIQDLLTEFEHSVDPAPARLAIGFSGQHRPNFRYAHLGGTRGPLRTHLLIREWVNQNSEAERLEVLVHELGHFLGAVHSPELNSVMRIALGDRRARSAKFRIGFDPLNTMAMCLLRDELAIRPDSQLAVMRPSTQLELRKIYTEVARTIPDDPAPAAFLRFLGPPGPNPPISSGILDPRSATTDTKRALAPESER